MRLSLGLLLTCFLMCTDMHGQALRWQQRFSWTDTDALRALVSLEDGTFLAVGVAKYTPSVAIVRFTDQGDTLYARGLPLDIPYPETIQLCRMRCGKVYMAVLRHDPPGDGILAEIDIGDGSILWSRGLPGVGPLPYPVAPRALCEGPNKTLLLAGDGDDPLGQAATIGYVGCLDTLGNPIWSKEIREHPSYTMCNHIEQTADGKVFVSGMAGSRIWAAELTADSGRELRRATFYQSLSLSYFDFQNAWVLQAPEGRYIVAGMIRANPYRYYLGLHQAWAGQKIWGSERVGGIVLPRINEDGSIIHHQQSTPSYLTRIRADSSIVWRSQLNNPFGSFGAAFLSYATVQDSSAIGVGVVYFRDSTDQDWYVARITNMGIPYDPSPVVSAAKQVEMKPYAYPTPCRESLGFSGLRSSAKLELVDMQGRMVLTTEIRSERMVDVSALVPGLYQYRLTSSGRVYSGRIMKE
ncbi:T9SS type A sorting domain-containing protein [Nostoc sp. NIES-2111]